MLNVDGERKQKNESLMSNDYAMQKRDHPVNLGLDISGVSLQHNNFDAFCIVIQQLYFFHLFLPFQSSPQR